MLVLKQKVFLFNTQTIYFSEYPFDVDGCDAVLFASCKNKVDTGKFACSAMTTAVTDLTQDLDVIWNNIRRRFREYINQASREGTKIYLNLHYDEFYRLYRNFRQSKGFASILEIGAMKLETMEKHGTLFTAEYDGELLGGHLYLEDEACIMLGPSASKRLEVDKKKAAFISRANRLLHWEAIKYAKGRGIREFDWGGLRQEGEAADDEEGKGVISFKLSFGGEVVTRYSYQKTYSKAYRLGQYLYVKANKMLR
jgi:hypothetical protein